MTLPYIKNPKLERWIYFVNGAAGGFIIALCLARNNLVTKWTWQSDISAYDSLDDLLGLVVVALVLVCVVILVDVWYAVCLRSSKK